MTVWERRIVETFLERYPASAAALGGRPLRIRTGQIFPGFETAPPDDRESFLEAAESLERQNILSLIWTGRRKGEALSALVCAGPENLFALAGKPSPSLVAEEARQSASKTARELSSRTAAQNAAPLFTFIAETLSPEDAAAGINPKAVQDLALLAAAFVSGPPASSHAFPGITPRALSVSLYADSKRLEELLAIFSRVLSRARRREIGFPDFLSLGRSFPETLIAGKFVLDFTLQTAAPPLVNAAGSILGLPLETVRKIERILPLRNGGAARRPSVLTVENKETFYALGESDFDCLLYTGGHPNGAVRALTVLLAASDFGFSHAGDLDPEGILILQELAGIADKTVSPLRMDAETFDRYAACGRRLENSALRRLKLIRQETCRLPGIAGLIRRIEETGLGVEQEIIDYRF
jgi:hypothetical protein